RSSDLSTSEPELASLTRTGTHSPFITPPNPGSTSILICPGDPSATPGRPRKKANSTKSPFQKRVLARLVKTCSSPLQRLISSTAGNRCIDAGLFPPQKLHRQIEQFLQRQIPSFSIQQTDQVSDRIRLPFGIGIPVDLPLFPPGVGDYRHPVTEA